MINGSSTTSPPIQVKIQKTPRKKKLINCLKKEKARPFSFLKSFKERKEGAKRIKTEANKAKTPPSLSGIDRRIA